MDIVWIHMQRWRGLPVQTVKVHARHFRQLLDVLISTSQQLMNVISRLHGGSHDIAGVSKPRMCVCVCRCVYVCVCAHACV